METQEAIGGTRQRRAPIYTRDVDNKLLVSIDGAASHFGVSRRTIYNWIAAGRVEVRRLPGGHARIVVERLAKERQP